MAQTLVASIVRDWLLFIFLGVYIFFYANRDLIR